jgi:hypothetical protein
LAGIKLIAEDSINTKRFESYADREYNEKEDLVKFKSYLVSLFTLCMECIKNWADWHKIVSPQTTNAFAQLRSEMEKKGV